MCRGTLSNLAAFPMRLGPDAASVYVLLETVATEVDTAEHLREYIEDLREELQWDTIFKKTQSQLAAAARRAKQEIAAGLAKPLDHDQL